MSRMIFEYSEKLKMMCWTEEGFQFVSSLYLVFHQIFLYRLKDIELDIGKYKHYRPVADISNFDEGYRVTLYTVYTLKILDVWDLDSVDRDALEGPDKNLYGWVPSGAIRAR